MPAHISPAVAAGGGVLPPRLRRMSAGNPAQCAGHVHRRSIPCQRHRAARRSVRRSLTDLLASGMPFAQPTTPASPSVRDKALDVLCSDALSPIVEVVLSSPAPDTYEAQAVDGRVRVRRETDGTGWRFEVEAVDGRNPLGDQAADRFVGLDAERAALHPH